jgi:hypothetical protein
MRDEMNATALTQDFARRCGYAGNSPAMLDALEKIRQCGIREARQAHADRMKQIKRFKANPSLFFATIRPSLSTVEAVEDANRYLAWFRNQPTWRQHKRQAELRRVKQARVYARYFRRFGARFWQQQEAA